MEFDESEFGEPKTPAIRIESNKIGVTNSTKIDESRRNRLYWSFFFFHIIESIFIPPFHQLKPILEFSPSIYPLRFFCYLHRKQITNFYPLSLKSTLNILREFRRKSAQKCLLLLFMLQTSQQKCVCVARLLNR